MTREKEKESEREGGKGRREKGLVKLKRKLLIVGPFGNYRDFGVLTQHDTRYNVLFEENGAT